MKSSMFRRIFFCIAALILNFTEAMSFEAKEITSPGGIKAWLVQDNTIPLFSLNFSMAGGAATDEKDKSGTAYFLSGMLNEGAGDLDSTAFQAKTEELAVQMSFDANVDSFDGTLTTLTKNRDEAFGLLKLALTKPNFTPEAMDRIRQQLIVGAQNATTNPDQIAYYRAAQLALPGHPYARRTQGTLESVAKITRDDLVAAQNKLIRRSGLTVSAVGDISAEDFGKILDDVFGALPDRALPTQAEDVLLERGPKLDVILYDNPQTVVVFGEQGLPDNDPNYIANVVMMEMLGGSSNMSWLTNAVREERGLTYGIGYSNNALQHAAFTYGSFSTVNAKAGEAMEIVRSTIKRMAETGPTQQQLDDIKTYMTGSYALRFDTMGKIAGFLTGLQLTGRPINFANIRNGLIKAVTLEQVKAQAQLMLHADSMVVVAVGKPDGLK